MVTYNGQDWGEDGKTTFGGYSDNYVVDNRYLAWVTNKSAIAHKSARAVKAVQSVVATEDADYIFVQIVLVKACRGLLTHVSATVQILYSQAMLM